MSGPLSGVRVLDLTTVLLGPFAAQMLGDMGADVIKIEAPGGDLMRQIGPHRNAGMASVFLGSNRNKRSLVLDLKTIPGRDALLRLVETADVFVHNMRVKAAETLGIGYDELCERNASLIYCAACGYNQKGPSAGKPAYDDIIQATCGLADLQASMLGEPRYVPSVIADKTTAMQVVAGICAALFHRARTGVGQFIEVPMFETMVSFTMIEHLYGQSFEPALGNAGYPRVLAPYRRPFRTRDGFVAMLPYTDRDWVGLLSSAGRTDLLQDERFLSAPARLGNIEYVYETLSEILTTKSSAEWLALCESINVPVMMVNTLNDLVTDKQLEATGFWQLHEHPTEGTLRMPSPPVEFSATPCEIRRLPPALGQHSRELLAEAGLSSTEINHLFDAGVTSEPRD